MNRTIVLEVHREVVDVNRDPEFRTGLHDELVHRPAFSLEMRSKAYSWPGRTIIRATNPYRELFLDVDVEVVSTCDPFSGACNSYASRVFSPGITLQTAQRDNKGHNRCVNPELGAKTRQSSMCAVYHASILRIQTEYSVSGRNSVLPRVARSYEQVAVRLVWKAKTKKDKERVT